MKVKISIFLILAITIAVGLVVPASADDAFEKGLTSFNAGQWTAAAAAVLAAVPMYPNDFTVRVTAGVMLANVKRYSDALKQFEAAARMSPDAILPQLLLDGVYSEMGKTAQARQIRYNTTRILSSKNAFGTRTSSDKILEASFTNYPQNAVAHCLLGDLYQLQDKPDMAKAQYSEASKLSPNWAKPVFNLGLAELNTNPKAAEEKFRYVLKVDPSSSRAHLWLGDAHLKQKHFTDAISEYQIAAKSKILWTEAQTRIGNAQMLAGNYSAASAQFERAANVDPQDPRPYAGRAQAMENSGQMKDAELSYNKAADILTQNSAPEQSQAVVRQQIGGLNARMGKSGIAMHNFQAAYEYYSTPCSASQLVEAQQKAGTLAASISSYENALRKNPRDTRAMLYLLYAYKATGNNTQWLNMASRIVKADPANSRTYCAEIGAAQMRLGNTDKAIDAYRAAVDAGDALTWQDTAAAAAQSGALNVLTEAYKSSFKKTPTSRTGKILMELQSARGDVQGTIETGEQLTARSPEDAALWLRLGQAYEQAGNAQAAASAYTKAASGSVTDAAALAKSRLEAMKGEK